MTDAAGVPLTLGHSEINLILDAGSGHDHKSPASPPMLLVQEHMAVGNDSCATSPAVLDFPALPLLLLCPPPREPSLGSMGVSVLVPRSGKRKEDEPSTDRRQLPSLQVEVDPSH